MTTAAGAPSGPTLFGHPVGLFTLFFAEMWERFSYYGMRALLVFYMVKGFLGYNDTQSYLIYGAYTSLVYMTPYFGGMIADRFLGARRAVVLGGLLMAMGHLMMAIESEAAFFVALAFLIVGNGFFKPSISTMVGGLYPKGSHKRDAGFTLFYMGINLGAAMSPVICGYVGETYGWHYGFGLATGGMLIGVAIFVAPVRLTQLLIVVGALATAVAMPFWQDTAAQLVVRLFLSAALLASALIAFVALNRGGLPKEAGAPPDRAFLTRRVTRFLRVEWAIYLGAVLSVPVFALLVQRHIVAVAVMTVSGVLALGYILHQAIFRCTLIERHRLYVVVILMFFVMLFWAFFEQAGSSMNNFTDRNVDRVMDPRPVTPEEIGETLTLRVPQQSPDPALRALPHLTQEQLGYRLGDAPFTMDRLAALREAAVGPEAAPEARSLAWPLGEDHVGMGVGGAEIPASEFQAANPIFILIFGLVFTGLWSWLGARGLEPSTPVKFALGLFQLALGFACLWYGAEQADERGMVWMGWLLLGYLFHTTGELCLSPVGLSMVTRMSPQRIVGTVMGAWFLATAFSNYLAGAIATLTGVGGEGDEAGTIPPPTETVAVYGEVFFAIAIAGAVAAVLLLALAPILKRWMHEGEDEPASSA